MSTRPEGIPIPYRYPPVPGAPPAPVGIPITTQQGETDVPIAPGLNPAQGEFAQGVVNQLDQSYKGRARQAFLDAGVPNLQDPMVQGMLTQIDSMSEFFDENPGTFEQMVGTTIQNLTTQGVITQTPYSMALQQSGFGFEQPEFNSPNISSIYNITPDNKAHVLAQFEGEGVDWVKNEQTGWVQWKNGTLVNPDAQFGDISAVTFDPTSNAPGSQNWLTQVVPKWSPDKINEWRGRLIEGGYLSADAKKGATDAQFLNALRQYQVVKYQNGGEPMAIGPQMPGSTGTTPFNFQQLKGQIANDIRQQWMATYGVQPGDDEIEPYQDMVIRTAHRLYQKGQLSASQAAVEAEERMVARMQSSPEAQFVTSNLEENTRLRDQILRAVQVTEAM